MEGPGWNLNFRHLALGEDQFSRGAVAIRNLDEASQSPSMTGRSYPLIDRHPFMDAEFIDPLAEGGPCDPQ